MPQTVMIDFECRDIGYGVESEACVTGHWTGEVDTWGKRTFAADDGRTLYLFPDEVLSEEEVEHVA